MRAAVAGLVLVAGLAGAQEPSGFAVTPQPDGGVSISLTAEQWAHCQRYGGCAIVSQAFLRSLVEQTVEHFCPGTPRQPTPHIY